MLPCPPLPPSPHRFRARGKTAPRAFLWVLSALLLAGCGNRPPDSGGAAEKGVSVSSAPDAAGGAEAGTYSQTYSGEAAGRQDTRVASAAAGGRAAGKIPAAQPRRIIYSASVEMVCEKFAEAAKRLNEAVRAHGGYVAESSVSSALPKNGTWKVRVPVERFEAFLGALGGVGEVQNSSLSSQDVSEEFYDLTARIRNKKVEEARLIQHLQQSTGKLDQILQVEREISRVREEVERMEGRQRFLANQTEMTTVTVQLTELRTIQNARQEDPSLGTQMWRTFSGSLSALGDFVKGVVLFLVGALPWAVVFAGVAVPLWHVRRRRREARRNAVRTHPAYARQNDPPADADGTE